MPDSCRNCGDDCDECCSDCCYENNGEGDKYDQPIFQEKKPKSKSRHIGIEIEFVSPNCQDEVARILKDAGLEKLVCLKDDGPVEGTREANYGHEICILTKEKTYLEDVKRVCDVLNGQLDADVNSTCGLHVHFDMRYRNKERVFKNLVASQDVLFQMQPPRRRSNTFCRRTENSSFQDAHRYGERYLAINASSYPKHKTIEVRLHSGTTNATKINNWIALLLKIINKRSEFKVPMSNLELLAKTTKLNDSIKEYVQSRITLFEGSSAQVAANNED